MIHIPKIFERGQVCSSDPAHLYAPSILLAWPLAKSALSMITSPLVCVSHYLYYTHGQRRRLPDLHLNVPELMAANVNLQSTFIREYRHANPVTIAQHFHLSTMILGPDLLAAQQVAKPIIACKSSRNFYPRSCYGRVERSDSPSLFLDIL